MDKVSIIYIGGIHSIGFAVFHLFFWKLFDWENDLKKLRAANRAIVQIANLRLIYIFLLIAAISFLFPNQLITSPLGNFFLLGISLFWVGRTVEQWVFLRVNHWMIHLLTFLFVFGAVIFALPLILNW